MKKILFSLGALFLGVILSSCSGMPTQIVRADEWQAKHPDVYTSYKLNSEMKETTYGGSVPIDYLEEYPNLKEFYEGYGFSKQYDRARGHTYALEDVINTERPKPGASCLSCKSADFVVALEKDGIDVNSMDFDEFVEIHGGMEGMEAISCYDCHWNEPGTINFSRQHLIDAINEGQIKDSTAFETLSCAQCHVEYYLDPETKEVIMPIEYGYETDDMLTYYDEIEFKDWEHPQTGAMLLKAQHPEMETFSGSVHENLGLSCIDCHMPEVTAESGEMIKSHHWTSPLKNEEGMKNSCLECHSNMSTDELIGWVEEVQGEVTDRTNEVSDKLVTFVRDLTAAKNAGNLTDDDLAKLQEIHRHAQFKWDFVFVENGEGFHNSAKAHKNLNEAEALLDEGNEILSKYN